MSARGVQSWIELERELDQASMNGTRVGLLTFYFLVAMLDGFDILVMAFTAAAVEAELALEPQELGVVFNSALLGMACGAMWLAPYGDKFGGRPAIAATLSVIALATLLTGACTALWQLICLRTIAGLGLGTLLAVLPTFVAEFSPERLRNLNLGILMSGTSLGGVVGGVIAGTMLEAYGWRSVFYLAGAATSTAALGALLFIPESVHSWQGFSRRTF
jgi:MFS family permease